MLARLLVCLPLAARALQEDWDYPMSSTEATIYMGESLNFYWASGAGEYHNVVQCDSAEALASCDCDDVLASVTDGGSYDFTPTEAGEYYFACTVGSHCQNGQVVTLTVKEAEVIDWDYPMASTEETIELGETVTFYWPSGASEYHNVVVCPDAASYESCDCDDVVASVSDGGSYAFTPTEAGMYYFACTVGSHCQSGQILALTVEDSSSEASPPPPASTSCEDSKGEKYCKKQKKKGKCANVMDSKCEYTCGGCGEYLSCDADTKSTKKCQKTVKKGKCSAKKQQKKCMTSCYSELGYC